MKTLFKTEVGSRAWGMEKPDSDRDLFCVYTQPASEYLRTGLNDQTRPAKTYMDGGMEVDEQFMEIGHLIGLLKKGNVNAIWAACSPIVHYGYDEAMLLRTIVANNLSKATYASINGMAHSQMNDVKKRATVRDPQKNRNSAARTLNFGISLLNTGTLLFNGVGDVTPGEVGELFRELDAAHLRSELPDVVDRKPFEDYLYALRMGEIIENDLVIRSRY